MNLITGATGMLGTHVMLELLKRGENVTGLKRRESDLSMVQRVFRHYFPDTDFFGKIIWQQGDVLDIESLQSAMRGIEKVYHCAAIVSYHPADRKAMFAVNVEGTANVVNAAIDAGVTKLCHVSSIAALGKSDINDWINENSEWKESSYNSQYGISKNLAELEVWRGVQEGLKAVVVNPGFIIGAGDFGRSSASIFPRIFNNLKYYPTGGTGFISAIECASCMVNLMEGEITNERFILVTDNLSMQEVFGAIAKAFGNSPADKPAGKGILLVVRFADTIREIFTGKKALVTKESARNASSCFFYKNDKIKKVMNIELHGLQDAITSTADFYRREM